MSDKFKVVLVDPTEESRDALKSLLMTIDSIWMEADCSRYEFFTDIVKSSSPEIAIISLDADMEKAMSTIQSVRTAAPSCSILAISESTDGRNILKAMRSGAKEYLNSPVDSEELIEAISRLQSSVVSESGEGPTSARVITVGGCSGGVGSTSIAVNIAAHLASDEAKRVALIDLDLALGDTDIYLDLIPEYTLLDVVQNAHRLDESLLEKTMTKHECGLFLLPRPVQLQEINDIEASGIRTMIEVMSSLYTHIVIDTSKAYSQLDVAAFECATDVLMITQLDLPCLRNVVRLMMSFEETEGLKEKSRVVMNRTGLNSGQISVSKAETFIGNDVYWQVPNDYKVMIDVRNNGVPLVVDAPKAGITKSICSLADKLCGVQTEAQGKASKRSLFSFSSKK